MLKHELNQLTEKIEKLDAVRAQYLASRTSQLTITKELERGCCSST